MQFNIDIKMRPIRIAFFIPPSDIGALNRAISVNSFLWGGHLNPIIPQFKRTPKQWQDEDLPDPVIKDTLNGYLDAFDPDFVTYIGCDAQDSIGDDCLKTIEIKDVVGELKSSGWSAYGVGYFELAQHVGHEEMRFERRAPLHLVAPSVNGKYSTCLSSVIGKLPEEISQNVSEQLDEAYGAPELSVSMDSFAECLDRSFLTPLRLMGYRLKSDHSRNAWERNCIFYFDASNFLDIVDFWNLRALGYNVLPLPKQAADQSRLIDEVQEFVKENYAVSQNNPAIRYHAKILRGRSIAKSEFDDFVKRYPGITNLGEFKSRLTIQPWFPRFWNQWDREHNHCECVRFFSDSSTSEVSPQEG